MGVWREKHFPHTRVYIVWNLGNILEIANKVTNSRGQLTQSLSDGCETLCMDLMPQSISIYNTK